MEECVERMFSVVIVLCNILDDSDFGWAVLGWVLLDRRVISVAHGRLVFLFCSSLERRPV